MIRTFSEDDSLALSLAPLPKRFYARPVLDVAKDCIGKRLVSRVEGDLVVGRIVETEAYKGPMDRAAHSYNNRRTPRTEAMFGEAGRAYVFQLYGLHYNFNVVTGEKEQPEAVLIRAIEPLFGLETMAKRRGMSHTNPNLTNGPGKLCSALGITKAHYGLELNGPLLFLAEGEPTGQLKIARSPRIGIDYAGSWARKPWRFFESDNLWVSRPRRSGRQ